MEEVKAAAAPPFSTATENRPLDSDAHSTYLDIRAAVGELRPHLLEVMRTRNFKKCPASLEIQQQLKTVTDLYKQLPAIYIVGGSPSTLNFITYPGSKKPVYCGISKEQFLSRSRKVSK